MEATELAAESTILILRFALLLVLYLFLTQLVVLVWRDLHRPAAGEVAPRPRSACLVVVEAGGTSYQSGHAFPLQDVATLGRGPDNTIVLADGFVSTNHATLAYQEGGWWLADLHSRNGTSVNGKRVSGEVRIQPDDVVSIGQVKLRLEV